MIDAEHPIDLLDEAPEGDAIEQQQTADDPTPRAEAAPTGTQQPCTGRHFGALNGFVYPAETVDLHAASAAERLARLDSQT